MTPTPEGGKSLRGRLSEAGGNLQLPRHTRLDPCRSKHDRPKCDPATREVQHCDTAVFDDRLTQWACVAQGLFFGGFERWAVAHTHPTFPKMLTAPSVFSLLGALQALDDEPPKGVKAWGESPLRPKEISRYRDTLGQIRAAVNTAGRSATRQLKRCSFGILLPESVISHSNIVLEKSMMQVSFGPTTNFFFDLIF